MFHYIAYIYLIPGRRILYISCICIHDYLYGAGVDVVLGDVLPVVVSMVDGAGVDVVLGDVLALVVGIVDGAGVDVVFGGRLNAFYI